MTARLFKYLFMFSLSITALIEFSLQAAVSFSADSPYDITIPSQFSAITAPTPDEATVIAAFNALPLSQVNHAIKAMDGEQYSSLLFNADLTNDRFLRRLYDPVRPIINNLPCYDPICNEYNTSYINTFDLNCCDIYCGLDFWFSLSGNRTYLDGNKNASHVQFSGHEFNGGVQSTFEDVLTLGIGVSYAQDTSHFRIGGHGRNSTLFVGAYGVYRPEDYYLMVDGTLGYSDNKLTRHIKFGTIDRTTVSYPTIRQGSFYVEGGKDFLWDYVLIQPFAGLELGGIRRRNAAEIGAHSLDLVIKGKSVFKAESRLGVHLTAIELPCQVGFSLDVAWEYLFVQNENHISERFKDFGVPFAIRGNPTNYSNLDVIVNISKGIFDEKWLFVEAEGRRWQNAYSYNFLAGLTMNW